MVTPPGHASTPTRRRPWLMIIGGVLVLLAILSWVLGTSLLTTEASDIESLDRGTDPRTVQLDAGESTQVYAESAQARCTVDGPEGRETNDGTDATRLSLGSGELYGVMTVDAEESGDHVVECTAGFVVHDQPGGWVWLPLGCAVGCLGFVLFLVGLVLWLVRRSAARRPLPPPPG